MNNLSSTLMSKVPVITLDGPTGSGKGTISLRLAQHFAWHFLDSGAIYRIFALAVAETGLSPTDEPALVALAHQLDIRFATDNSQAIFLGERDCSRDIRREAISALASEVSALAGVRVALMNCQRQFRQMPGLVADGRDMGTVVFPDAPVKIFLSASAEVRAVRRYKQLLSLGLPGDYDLILKELKVRDERDKNRTVAPLKPATEALCIDSSLLSIEQVIDEILAFALPRLKAETKE